MGVCGQCDFDGDHSVGQGLKIEARWAFEARTERVCERGISGKRSVATRVRDVLHLASETLQD